MSEREIEDRIKVYEWLASIEEPEDIEAPVTFSSPRKRKWKSTKRRKETCQESRQSSVLKDTHTEGLFSKILKSLRRGLHGQRRERRFFRNLSSSSSEPHPGTSGKRKTTHYFDRPSTDELHYEERIISDSNMGEEKIHVISIQPGSSGAPQAMARCYCCEHLLKNTNKFYLKFISHIKTCNSGLLRTDTETLGEIIDVLHNPR